MPESKTTAISEDSIDFLEDVKKGKPRRFVMICQGASIESLVVYKKGNVDKYIKEAKASGKGTISYGIVDGKGPNISFKLSRAEGFKKEPTTTAKLKGFLKDEGEFTCNPLVELVDAHAPMLDADDPLVARFMKLGESSLLACDNHPDRASEIYGFCTEIGEILDKDSSSDAAHGKIGKLETLLSSLLLAPPPKKEEGPKDVPPPENKEATGFKSRIAGLFGLAFTAVSEGVKSVTNAVFGSELEQPKGAGPDAPKLDPEAAKFKARLSDLLKQATPYVPTIGTELKALANEARELAEQGNYTDANERLKQLVVLIKKAQTTPTSNDAKEQMGIFTERLNNLRPSLETLKVGDSPAKLAGSEAVALVKQASGYTQKSEFEQAFGLMTQAEELASKGLEELAVRQEKLKEAFVSLRLAQTFCSKVKTQVTSDLGTLPKELSEKFSKIEQSLALEKETDPAKVEKAADDSGDSLLEIDNAAKKLIEEKQAYDSDLRLIEGRIASLENHTQATVVFIQGKITEIKKEVEAAKTLATEHKFVEGSKKLLDVADLCLTTEGVADEHSQYTTVLSDRETRVNGLATATQVPVQEAINKAKQKLTQAKQLATSNKFGKAVKLLNELPKECMDAAWLKKQAADYDTALDNQKKGVKAAKTWTPDVSEAGPYMPAVEQLLADAAFDKTNDYPTSITMLERVAFKLGELWNIIGAFSKFRDEYRKVETKINDLDTHAGKAGIAKQLAKMKGDKAFAEQKRDASEYVTAMNVCLNILKEAGEAKPVADECKAYLDRKKQVEAKRKEVTDKGNTKVDDWLGEADRFISDAANLATKHEYLAAKKGLDEAFQRLDSAKQTIGRDEAVEKHRNNKDPLIENLDSDFEAANTAFTQLFNYVKGKDTDNIYGPGLTNAKDKSDNARVFAEALVPDFDQAKAMMREAMVDLHDLQLAVDQCKAYKEQRTPVVSSRATLNSPNRNNTLKDFFDTIDDKLQKAEDAYNDSKFKDAFAHLTEARMSVLEAERSAALYDQYMSLRNGAVAVAINAVDTVQGRTALTDEVAKLKTDRTASDNLLNTQKKFKEALDALKQIKKDADLLKPRLAVYIEAKGREKRWITDHLPALQGKPIVADELAEIESGLVELNKKFVAKQFSEATKMASVINWTVQTAERILAAHGPYVVDRDRTKNAIDELKKVTCDAVKDDIKTAENFYSKAEVFANDRNFEMTKEPFAKAEAACIKPTATGKAYALYAPSLKAAQDAIAALTKDFPKNDAVDLAVQGLKGKLASAEQSAKKKDFVDAKLITDAIATEEKEIRKTAQTQGEFDSAVQGASAPSTDSVDGLEAEINKVKDLVTKLTNRKLDELLKANLARINKFLETAETERKANRGKSSRAALRTAAEECASANAKADQFVLIDKSLTEGTNNIDKVRKQYAVPPYVKLTTDDLDKQLAMARQDAQNDLFSSAQNQLQSALVTLAEVEQVGKDHAAYLADRQLIDPRVEKLAKKKARYTLAEELGEIRAYLVEAEGHADKRDFREANKMINAAIDLCDAVEFKSNMHEDEAVDEVALKKLLGKPGGEKQIDQMIKGLDPRSKRKACQKVLELRFDMKLELFTDKDGNTIDADMEKQGPDVTRLYEIMAALPKSHTRENPSMKTVKRIGEETGTSSFSESSRVLELRVGRATDKTERMIAQEWELGDVDDDAKPSDDKPPTKFSWTTLHEIGHAVDDRLSFMKKNGSKAEYGGWKDYGSNVGEIAKAAAAHFGYDKAYVEAYLAGDKLAPPEPTGGEKPEEWDQKRIEVETWCDSIRHDKSIYYSASACERLKIGDRIYLEAYEKQWYSYDVSARKKGVAGYQFRAPGEWFAEIYAAYFTGKMNKKHPAREWLSKL